MAKQQTTNELLNEQMLLLEAQRAYESEMSRSFTSLLKGLGEERKIRKEILSIEREISNIEKILKENKFKGVALDQEDKKLLEEKKKQYQDIATRSKTIVDGLNKQKAASDAIWNSGKKQLSNAYEYSKVLSKDILKHLDSQDGLLKQMNLEFGVTNQLSSQFTKNIISASKEAGNLLISTSDLVKIQNTYVETTGKLSPLSKRNLLDISAIATRTGLGAENTAKMVGEFESLGLSVSRSKEIVQEIANTSANFGVSMSGTLKLMNDNFTKLSKHTFKNGVKDLAEMSKYSLKFKTNMEGMFNAMDKSRTLEGSLEMASQLMVMGGKFANMDPFTLNFNARNDPKKFQEDINSTLKGLATFNKQSKQFDVSSYDLDRLRSVAEATNMPLESLKESAIQLSKLDLAKKSMFAGSKADREFIATIAQANGNGGFEISVDGKIKDLSKLTNTDIALLKQQQESLETSISNSRTFDSTMQSLILNLKGSLLPLLNITNSILDKFKWVVDKLGGVESGFVQTLAGITLALGTFSVLKGVFSPLTGLVGALKSGITSKGGGIAEQIGSSGTSDLTGKNGASPAGTTANYARAASIAAIGVAAVGIGYGIKLAAEGFTGLGDSMAKMDIETKNKLLTAMGITALGLVVPIIAIGIAGEKSALGLLALGAAAVGVGAGMKLFAEGYNIFSNPKIPDLNSLNILKTINFDTMKTAFVEANNFLKGDSSNLDKLKNQLEDLRVNFNLGVDNLTKELKTLNDKGITARFDKSEASINITIENIIDGEKIVSKNSRTVAIEISNTKKGKSAFSF